MESFSKTSETTIQLNFEGIIEDTNKYQKYEQFTTEEFPIGPNKVEDERKVTINMRCADEERQFTESVNEFKDFYHLMMCKCSFTTRNKSRALTIYKLMA